MPNLFYYTIILSFTSGIFARSFFDVSERHLFLLFVLSFSLALVWRYKRRSYQSVLFLSSLMLLFFALGLLRLDLIDDQPLELAQFEEQKLQLEGVVIREPDIREKTIALTLRVDGVDDLVLVRTERYQDISYGDRITAIGTLKRPEAFETDLGRTFNYPGFLKARGVTHTMSFAEVEVRGEGEGNSFIALLFTIKQYFMTSLEGVIEEPQVGLGEGLLLGVKQALGDDLETAFRRTGIIHIVVLSGYNVMIVAEAIMRLLSFVFVPRVRLVIGIAAIGSFALLVGLGATVVRASIMAILILIARATGRIYAILRALILAGFLMLLINPYLLVYDPGFQLSFLATLGLILLTPLLERRITFLPSVFGIKEFFLATVATQIFVLPLLIYLIGEFSVVSVLVNVLVLPMVPLAMLLTFITGLAGFVLEPLALIVGFIATFSLSYITATATLFAALPFAALSVPQVPFVVVVLGYVLLGYVIYRGSTTSDVVEDEDDDEIDLSDWTIVEEKDLIFKTKKRSSKFPF